MTSFGALVQLVRMPACHAGGHGFESRTHRKKQRQNNLHKRGVAQLVAFLVWDQAVAGSSPVAPTKESSTPLDSFCLYIYRIYKHRIPIT